jgi:hypothetical protein
MEGFLWQWCRWLKKGNEEAAREYRAELMPAVAVPSLRVLARPLRLGRVRWRGSDSGTITGRRE